MRRRRRAEDDDSSLELLLDTMCNTFGGVMFIAISVFVLLASMTQDESFKTEKVSGDPETLRREITQLQTMIEQLQQDAQIKNELLKLQKSHTVTEQVKEIMLLQQIVRESTVKLSAEKIVEKTLTEQKKSTLQQVVTQQQTLLKQQQTLKELQLQENMLKQQIADLTKITKQRISFKLIKPDSKAPFFLMTQGNQIWPVGPWKTPDKGDVFDPSVTHTKHTRGKMQIISCNVKQDRGINILENGKVTADFLALMKKIPNDRIPKFFVTPGSAASVFKMRSYLKKNNIDHGCNIAGNDNDPLQIQYVDNANYEY